MGSKVLDAGTLRGRFHDVPNRLGRDSIAPDLSRPTYSPEDRTTIDASRRGPLIDGEGLPTCPEWFGEGGAASFAAIAPVAPAVRPP